MSIFKREGSDVYSYDFRFRGHRFSGATGCTTKRRAEEFEAAKRKEVAASEIDTAKPLTFAAAASLYWHEVGAFHANPKDTLRDLAWLTKHVGKGRLIVTIDNRLVAELVARRRGELVAPSTVNRTVIEPLRAILRRAADVWSAKVTRIEWKTHILRVAQEIVREASVSEEEELLAAHREDYRPALKFAVLSGCRRAEIVGLEWTSVDFFNRDFRVTGKGDRSRTIPMTTEIFDLLWSLRQHHPTAVFSYSAARTRDGRIRGERYPITKEGFKTAWRRSRAKTDILDFRFHDTRHTGATRLVRATGNLKLAQHMLGHADIKTTSRYAHVTHEDLRNGMEASSKARSATQNATDIQHESLNELQSKDKSK